MARTLTEIYTQAKETREEYLGSTGISNSSKMSIMDMFTWITSSCIWVFENLLDTFQIDIASDLQNRVNGTPAYYASALMKYQHGDSLQVNSDGTAFVYPTIDETKRIITRVGYAEHSTEGFHDKYLVLKTAKGTPGAFSPIDDDELLAVRSYVNQIKFAGTDVKVVSRKGDVLIPRLTVFYDGAVEANVVYDNIEKSLNKFIANVDFDGVVYVQKIIDAIQSTENVVDVYIDTSTSDQQGVFVAQYDDNNLLVPTQTDGDGVAIGYERKVERFFAPNSGCMTQ